MMNLEEAIHWAKYKAYIVDNLKWFVISLNEEYVVINETSYNRKPDTFNKIIKYEINYEGLTKKELTYFQKRFKKFSK